MTVRTRFAPSPTGYLHIGGVRTALFNWLFARRHGGQFVLRIDDTDRQRNVEAALEPILHGFRWLGLDWDEGPEVGGSHGPYYQSERTARYQSAVESLLERGAAYWDFARPEELEQERNAAQEAGESFTYSRRWAAESEEQREKLRAEGRPGVVRLKMPRQGTLELSDLVRGDVSFQWAKEQDHVIQRADGSVLYNLATVVDDHEMEISHVIRAEEHLSNTPRQWFIYDALGWQPPEFAHLPFVAEPGSKTKLSKRKLDKYLKHRDFAQLNTYGERIAQRLGLETSAETFNPVIVEFYEKTGFLPDALVNYLLLLGWALDDATEDFTRDEMIAQFSLEGVNKSPASFDPAKLLAFQQRAMDRLPIKQKVALCVPYLQQAGLVEVPPPCDLAPQLNQIISAAGDRLKTAADILDFEDFFLPDNGLRYDEKAFEKRIRKPDDAVPLLTDFAKVLGQVEPFDAAHIEQALKQFCTDREIKIGQIIHALRVAITGKAVGFGMFETLEILGKEACLARISATRAAV